jgi:hypothetical protein
VFVLDALMEGDIRIEEEGKQFLIREIKDARLGLECVLK